MPKPLRLPDDDRPRKKKPAAPKDGLPLGPLVGAGVGGLVLLGVVGLVWWAVTRDGPPPPKPVAPTPATTPAPPAKTPPTEPKVPTADELYQWLVGGAWTRTADSPAVGKMTTTLTFLADATEKTLVVRQQVPDLLGTGSGQEVATTLEVSEVQRLADGSLRIRTKDADLLGAGFKRFKLRFEPEDNGVFRVTLTEPGDESRFQPTPYTRQKAR